MYENSKNVVLYFIIKYFKAEIKKQDAEIEKLIFNIEEKKQQIISRLESEKV